MRTVDFVIAVILVLGILGMVIPPSHVSAQSYGTFSFGPIAPVVAKCPAGQKGQVTLCGVGTTVWVSYNGAAYKKAF
jgi:hypothetical protein